MVIRVLAILLAAMLICPYVSFAYSGDGYEICHLNPKGDNFLALREGPGSNFKTIMKLGPGSVVESRGNVQNGWLEVVVEMANRKTYLSHLPQGFIYVKYICPF
ncbi:SH3 domain-containing protein [Martelella alba]|uniref:SH3 domain-containing protein n=1 Tax=Martelella alba TaxID=2590451 RepID=A0A506U316_9HYPH|nr:SH3 domain-containing protein [Martelella alba]TPW27385.1 SH3 domain-containing protein [Martelella alba]